MSAMQLSVALNVFLNPAFSITDASSITMDFPITTVVSLTRIKAVRKGWPEFSREFACVYFASCFYLVLVTKTEEWCQTCLWY